MQITLESLSKRYGKVSALRGVSLDIAPRQVVAIVGRNGAGKTTLLRCLAGIVVPSGGRILYDGEQFRRDRLDLRRRLHFLPDFPFVFGDFTPIQHLSMALRLYGVTQDGLEDRALDIFRALDLLPVADRKLAQLSRGEIYKSALSALVLLDPELWLLDEPFASGMDPNGITWFKDQARAAARRGHTVIYSTQILEVAERSADRVCVIEDGSVHLFDTVESLQREHRMGGGGALEQIFRRLREDG